MRTYHISLMFAWTNFWTNTQMAGDLRHDDAHVTSQICMSPILSSQSFSYYRLFYYHYNDVIMSAMVSQITSLAIIYSTIYSGADQRKHQSSASLAFVRGIHRWPVNSLHKWPVKRKMFPFDYVIMILFKRLCVVLGVIPSERELVVDQRNMLIWVTR